MTAKLFYRTLLSANVIGIAAVSLSPASGQAFDGSDKIGHFLIYGSLAFIIGLNFKNRRWRVIALLTGIAYGGLMEICQSLIPRREASMYDQLANAFGIVTGVMLFRFSGKKVGGVVSRFLRKM